MNPGGGSGWDEPPLDIQIPDDARELDRDVLAYHRELRAKRRRSRIRRLAAPFAARGSIMPLLASILAVCLVAGAMLSVATISPATVPSEQTAHPTTAASSSHPATPASSPAVANSAAASASSQASGSQASGGAQASGRARATRSAKPTISPASAAPSSHATATSR